MWRVLLAAALFFSLVLTANAQNPGIAQSYYNALQSSQSAHPDFFNCHCVKIKLPNADPGGNTYFVWTFWGDTTSTVTIIDDKGDTFTSLALIRDTTDSDSLQVWSVPVSAGAQLITMTYSPTTLPNNPIAGAIGFDNVGVQDGSPCTANAVAGTSAPCSAAITTTQADLVIDITCNANTGVKATWTAGSGFTIWGAQDYLGCVAEYDVQSVQANVTPTITATSSTFDVVGAAFKKATAGSAFTGGKIISVMSYNIFPPGLSSPFTLQPACDASSTNFISGEWIAPDFAISSLSGSVSGAWTNTASAPGSGAVVANQAWTKTNASTGPTDTLTLTLGGASTSASSFVVQCIQNALTASAIGTTQTNTGSNAAAGAYTVSGTGGTTGTFTPAQANDVVIVSVGVQSNNINPTTVTPQTAFEGEVENDPTWHDYNANTSAITFQATSDGGGNASWSYTAFEVKLAAGGGGGGGNSGPCGAILLCTKIVACRCE